MGAGERPEALINYYAKTGVGVRKINSAIGFIALLWSSVVLLGGFVSILRIKDFWFLSILSLVMASKIVEIAGTNIGGLFLTDIYILRLSKGLDRFEGADRKIHWIVISAAVIVKQILMICVSSVFGFSSYVSIALSVERLVKRDYGDASGDVANKAKLEAALIIFYVLVIFHSLSVLYWGFLGAFEPWMLVSEQLGFGEWGPKIVRRYRTKTRAKCHKDGVLPNNWNLITFSVELLESASLNGPLWGARVLDTFIGKGITIRRELLSSSQAIQNLIDTFGLTSKDNREMRERAARIVADLASELHITQFPDALSGICCLLESSKQYSDPEVAHPPENSEQTLDENPHKVSVENLEHGHHQEDAHLSLAITEQNDHRQVVKLSSDELPKRRSWIQTLYIHMTKTSKERHEWERYFGNKYYYSYVSKGTKELISQGLVILERLTQDEENCIEILKHQMLLSKITLPLSYQDFLSNGWDQTWVEMTVVSRLISVESGDDTTRLRHDMSCNRVAVRNLMHILEVDSEGARELHEQAIVILTELAFDDSFRNLAFDASTGMTEMFVKRLRRIFLEDNDGNTIVEDQDKEKDNRVRRKAGEALARLLRVPSARDDALTSATNVNAVDLLPKQDMINLLTRVVDQILSSKAGNAAHVATQAGANNIDRPEESQPPNGADTRQSSTRDNEERPEERKLLGAMLSLAVAICNRNLICRDDFSRAVPDDSALVKKLKEITETNNDATTDGWRILKLVCQVVIAMVQLKPSCITKFNEHSFKESLSNALKTMSDVDNCMPFAGNDREVPARSLTSLVKEANELLGQEQGNISA